MFSKILEKISKMGQNIFNSKTPVAAYTFPDDPTPTPKRPSNYEHSIRIPSEIAGNLERIDPKIAQYLMESFDDIGKATEAARILKHPMMQTRTETELKRMKPNYNRGENPDFITGKGWHDENTDGSIDSGLFRINDRTFADYLKRFPREMSKQGLNDYSQMYDPRMNTRMARMIYNKQGYPAWYAADIELRNKKK